MTTNYYAVTAKFSHVGRNKTIIKTVAVKAESGKDAAYRVRWMGRVKHHAKDAIIDVKAISQEEYELLRECVNEDPYFSCSNIQEQRLECDGIEDEIIEMRHDEIDYEKREINRKNKVNFQKRKQKVLNNEYFYMMKNYEATMSY